MNNALKNTVVAVIVLALAGAMLVGYKLTQTLTYASDEYGFSFEYPKDYVLTDANTGTLQSPSRTLLLTHKDNTALPENGEGPTTITFNIYPHNDREQSLEDWLRSDPGSNFNLITDAITSTTVDGASAMAYTWDGLYPGRTVAFKHKGNIIAVSGTYLSLDDEIRSDFESVMSSIRLYE